MFGQSLLSGAFGTALVPGENFNTVLYTGNDVSHAITGVGFKPDFVWIKRRNSSESHALYDSLRGINKQLSSDSSGAQATNTSPYEGFTSFDTDGFTVDNNGATNRAPNTYVAWNWKAGADTYAGKFNGSSSVIDISSSIINVGTPYTISMWLNFSDVTAYKGVFANITSSRLTNEIAVVLNNGKITIYSVASNGNTSLDAINATPQSAIANNTWYNVVIVADRSLANKAKVYFNSVETSYTYSAGVAGTAAYSNTKIGLADGQYFDGQMDQIRLFNSVLTTSQISDLYGETSETTSTLDFPAGAGCVTGYTLDTNANTIAPIPNSTTGVTTCDFPTGAGCQALYQLEDNVTDTCGNYNGTANNITYASGVFGNAASFNGTSSYIDIGGTIANSQSNLTVSMWLYWDGNTSNANDYFILLGNSSTGTAGSLFACNIITASGILRFYNGSTTYDSTSAISANTWTQIAITYASSGDLKFYISGTLDASHSAGALSLGASSNRGLIGGYVFGANPVSLYYGGSIDQVRIFNTVLTQSQVNELARGAEYNGTSSNVTYVKPGYTGRNNDGTIESQVSANQDAGFSVVQYTGNGSASQTYGHGLSNKPSLIITKKTSGSQNWTVWHEDLTSDNYFLYLNTDAAEGDGVATAFNSGISTSLVGIGNSGLVNDSGQDYISYCFASISAYSKIGSYSGTGATNNITGLGFEPRWVLIKCTDSGGTNWQIWDSARTTGYNLFPNLAIGEVDNSSTFTGFTADGFTVAGTSGSANASGSTYLYMAFA